MWGIFQSMQAAIISMASQIQELSHKNHRMELAMMDKMEAIYLKQLKLSNSLNINSQAISASVNDGASKLC